MFDFLFGWRKASKCKKLIRRVQCRLKLLKNKRSTIVRQLRDDIAELLKHGHGRTAFDRVEQLFKDESLVAVYDLLDNFCEFIIVNLHYIRRNKDCPNDINAAVSSLIFASARFGDLPELISIRKLFGERYGQRFSTVAVELLPGNLVNRQMQEKICIKSVSDDEKSRLVEEILKSSLQSGPLLLEYSSELQQKSDNKSSGDPIPSTKTLYEPNEDDKLEVSNTKEEEGKLVHGDFSSESKILKNLCRSLLTSNSRMASSYSVSVQQTPLDTVASLMHEKNQGLIGSSAKEISHSAFEPSDLQQPERSLVVYDSALRREEENANVESSSESSAQFPEEMICLDDIQEFEYPVSKEGSLQDQRLFKFRSSVVPLRGKIDNSKDEALDQGRQDFNEKKSASMSFRKNRNASTKRLRRRSVSVDATGMNDVECSIYYGKSSNGSQNYDTKCHDRQNHPKKNPIKRQQKSYYVQEIPNDSPFINIRTNFSSAKHADDHTKSCSNRCSFNNKTLHNCSLEHPCYACTTDDFDYMPPHKPMIQLELYHCCCSRDKNPQVLKAEQGMHLNQKEKSYEDAKSPSLLISTCSGSSSSSASLEGNPSYTRAMTMPLERPKDAVIDNMIRSNSFPFKEHGLSSTSSKHVHPKLPDYDELAAKFMALKKANLQCEK